MEIEADHSMRSWLGYGLASGFIIVYVMDFHFSESTLAGVVMRRMMKEWWKVHDSWRRGREGRDFGKRAEKSH